MNNFRRAGDGNAGFGLIDMDYETQKKMGSDPLLSTNGVRARNIKLKLHSCYINGIYLRFFEIVLFFK